MQGLTQVIELSAALITLILATVWDVRFRRIPNAVSFSAILLGLILMAFFRPGDLPLTVLTLILLFFFGVLHLMGQGDIKLVMALTALCGPPAALISTGIAAVLIVSVQILLYPSETVADAKNAFGAIIRMDFKKIYRKGRSVPFAPYILAGYIFLTVYRLFH